MLSLEKQKKNWRSWCFIVHGLKYQALPTLHDESNTRLIKCSDTCFFIRNFIFYFSLKLLWENHNFSLKAVKTGGKRVHVHVSFREQNHMFGFYNNKIFAFFILITNRVKCAEENACTYVLLCLNPTEKTQVTLLKIPFFSFENPIQRLAERLPISWPKS